MPACTSRIPRRHQEGCDRELRLTPQFQIRMGFEGWLRIAFIDEMRLPTCEGPPARPAVLAEFEAHRRACMLLAYLLKCESTAAASARFLVIVKGVRRPATRAPNADGKLQRDRYGTLVGLRVIAGTDESRCPAKAACLNCIVRPETSFTTRQTSRFPVDAVCLPNRKIASKEISVAAIT